MGTSYFSDQAMGLLGRQSTCMVAAFCVGMTLIIGPAECSYKLEISPFLQVLGKELVEDAFEGLITAKTEEKAEFELSKNLSAALAAKYSLPLMRDKMMHRCVFDGGCKYKADAFDKFNKIKRKFAEYTKGSEEEVALPGNAAKRAEGKLLLMKGFKSRIESGRWLTAAKSVHYYEKNPGPYDKNSCKKGYEYCEDAGKMQVKLSGKQTECEECMKAAAVQTSAAEEQNLGFDANDLLSEVAGADNHADELADELAETETWSCYGGWG